MSKPHKCPDCYRGFRTAGGMKQHRYDKHIKSIHQQTFESDDDDSKDFGGMCCVCDASPTVAGTDLCGPCCFGEADTVGGNW